MEVIARMWWLEGQTWTWTPVWKRELTSIELQRAEELFALLSHNRPIRNQDDLLLWGGKTNFSARKLQQKAVSISNQGDEVDTLI